MATTLSVMRMDLKALGVACALSAASCATGDVREFTTYARTRSFE